MPNKTQPPNDIFSSITQTLQDSVKKDDLKRALDSVGNTISRLRVWVTDKVGTMDAKLDAETKRLGEEVAEFEKRLRAVQSGDVEAIRKDLAQQRLELQADIDAVDSRIPAVYDDNELRQKIEQLRADMPQMPEEFDATFLVEAIDGLDDRMDKLEKRPISSGGGGVGFKNVEQLAKYFVKKETPTGTFDGVNTDFTVTKPIFAVLGFSLNSRMIHFDNYTIADKTITFDSAPSADYANKDFQIIYI